MTEHYLPIKESLGYKNVKQALQNVFSVNLDDIQIRAGEYENFSFLFTYNNYFMTMLLSSTKKNTQFNFGEGGMFDILFPNPKYPEHSFLEETFFHNLLVDEKMSESVESVFGKAEKSVEHALQVLKDFLDSDDAKVLFRK